MLLVLLSASSSENSLSSLAISIVALPALVAFSMFLVRYLLQPLFSRFDRIGEYIFLLTISWCLGIAELAEVIGLSKEIGAFIAGISLATSPIAQYIALKFKAVKGLLFNTIFLLTWRRIRSIITSINSYSSHFISRSNAFSQTYYISISS